MPSLFRAIKNWFRAKKDDAAEALSDPIRDGKFDIEDSEKKIVEFKGKIARLMTVNKNRKDDKAKAEQEVVKWANIAEQAANAGNRPDVESAINNKHSAEAKVKAFGDEVANNDKVIASLRKQLEGARQKIANAKSQHAQLAARMEGAKVRKELSTAGSDLGDGPLARLDNLANAVQTAENEAESYEELNESDSDNLADKYSTSNADVSAEVEALMNKSKTPV